MRSFGKRQIHVTISSLNQLQKGQSTWTGTVLLCRYQAPLRKQTTLLSSIIHGVCSLYAERGVLGPTEQNEAKPSSKWSLERQVQKIKLWSCGETVCHPQDPSMCLLPRGLLRQARMPTPARAMARTMNPTVFITRSMVSDSESKQIREEKKSMCPPALLCYFGGLFSCDHQEAQYYFSYCDFFTALWRIIWNRNSCSQSMVWMPEVSWRPSQSQWDLSHDSPPHFF